MKTIEKLLLLLLVSVAAPAACSNGSGGGSGQDAASEARPADGGSDGGSGLDADAGRDAPQEILPGDLVAADLGEVGGSDLFEADPFETEPDGQVGQDVEGEGGGGDIGCAECVAPLTCVDGKCVECVDDTDEPWDGCRDGDLTEFQVNSWTDEDQAQPCLVLSEGGGFVIGWDGKGDGDKDGVYFRVFGADGGALTEDVRANEVTESAQALMRLAPLPGGGFAAAWTSGVDGEGAEIRGRVFDADGAPAGDEFGVSDGQTGQDHKAPWVAALSSGRTLVTWAAFGVSGGNHDVLGRLFDADGKPLGPAFPIPSDNENDQQYPTAAPLPSGFVVFWQSKPQDGGGYGVFGRLLDVNGAFSGEVFQANETTPQNQWTPWVSTSADGGFVVAWDGNGTVDDQGISARPYSAAGAPKAPETVLNQETAGDQWEASVAVRSDGSFVAAWESWVIQNSEGEVHARLFSPDGAPLGDEFQANMETYDGQGDPSIGAFADGSFIVVWYSFAQDGSGRGIFGRRYSPSGDPLLH